MINGKPAKKTKEVAVDVQSPASKEVVLTSDFLAVPPGTPFNLDAVVSNTNDGYQYTYKWEQVDNTGVRIPLNNSNSTNASGVAPLERQTYAFDFVLTGISFSGATSQIRQRVHLVVGGAIMVPKIDITSGSIGEPVVMRANMPAGYGVITDYRWTQVTGPESITLSSRTSSETMFIPVDSGIYGFELKATSRDSSGTVVESTQIVQVNIVPPPPPPIGIIGTGN